MGWFKDLTGISTPGFVKDVGDFAYNANTLGVQNDINRAIAGEQSKGIVGQTVVDPAMQSIGLGADSGSGDVHTIKNEPWSAIQPSLIKSINSINQLAYNGNQLAIPEYQAPGAATQAGLDRMQAGMSPYLSGAQGFYGQLMQGQSNPYLDATFGKAADAVRAKLDSQFAAAGRYGSGDQAREIGQAYNDLATNIYGGAYESDMGRRMQGLGLAPTLDQAAYQSAARQYGAGQLADQQAYEAQNWDYTEGMRRLNDYLGLINAAGGNYSSQTQPIYENKAANFGSILTGIGSLAGAFL